MSKNKKQKEKQAPPLLFWAKSLSNPWLGGVHSSVSELAQRHAARPAQLEIRGSAPSHAGGQNLRIPHADASKRMLVQFLQNYPTGQSSEERARGNRGASNAYFVTVFQPSSS
jgi:hypothetical protein